MRRSLRAIDAAVCNLAVGGSTVFDLSAQLTGIDVEDPTSIVLSIGTNDAAPWRSVDLEGFTDELARVLGRLNAAAVTYVAPPGVVEARVPPGTTWANATIDQYRATALDVCRACCVRVIRRTSSWSPLARKHSLGTACTSVAPVTELSCQLSTRQWRRGELPSGHTTASMANPLSRQGD
ncbi:SGNH/GDSL hydrolase family protein [Flexivirga endophytica]|uniref:SGNH/GDSL hydrolase family protein n=1 Tax=Flexivirga endophytica TaxID=1849103 RepID=UPI001666D572|nr:SGNH/GDSL hydrolase family protein [Flexivirga endophytica]